MPSKNNRICALSLRFRDRAPDGLNWILKIDPVGKFRSKPKRHPRRCDSDNSKLDPGNLLQNERLNPGEWVFCIGKFAGWFSFEYCVRTQHRHCRTLQYLLKRLHSPVELMVADNPRVVFEIIEQIDHQLALGPQPNICSLIHVADIDQDRVRILLLPTPDLRDATRQSTAVWISVVIGSRQNMAMEVRRMQDRDANRLGIERRSHARQSWDCAEQSRPANKLQERPSTPESIRMEHLHDFRILLRRRLRSQ